jgi:hypothetical protein
MAKVDLKMDLDILLTMNLLNDDNLWDKKADISNCMGIWE